jgi:transketolase
MSLRMMPNLHVYRPADAIETAECWELAVKNAGGPSLLALSRQNLLPVRNDVRENLSAKGGYRLLAAKAARKVVLLSTGSEVEIAVGIAAALEAKGIGADVISMPCWDRFDAQDASYRADILPKDALIVSIEAGVTMGWERYTGSDGINIGINSFGASAPIESLYPHFGLTVDAIVPQIVAKI